MNTIIALFSFFYLCFSDVAPLSLPKSLIPSNFAPQFMSIGQIRLIGFKSQDDPEKIKKDLMILLNNKFMVTDIIKDNPDIHHLFRANVEIIDLAYNHESELEQLIPNHFQSNNAHFAVYVIKTQAKSYVYNPNSQIFGKGQNWIAIKYINQSGKMDPAYQIAINVLDVLSQIFNYQIQFQPRISILFPHDSINVYQTSTYDSESIIKKSVSDLCTLNITVTKVDPTIFNVLCSSCSDSKCALSWIRKLPEYIESTEKGILPVFLMPPSCSFQYASRDVAFAPCGMEIALKSIIRKVMFGVETKPQAEPFFDILAQRNIAVFPLQTLMDTLSHPVDEINDLLPTISRNERNSAFNGLERIILRLSERYENFTNIQKQLTIDILSLKSATTNNDLDNIGNHSHGNEIGIRSTITAAKEHFDQLRGIAQEIVEIWNLGTESYVVKKRQCVGNLRDLTNERWFLTRPSLYFVLSIATSIVLIRYFIAYVPKNLLDTLFPEPSLPI